MITYISQLPSDLRTELQYYQNYTLVNKILNALEHFKVRLGAGSLKEAINVINKHSGSIIPSNIEFTVNGQMIYHPHYCCDIRFISPHLLTLQHFVLILNNIYANKDHFFEIGFRTISLINEILLKEGYTEQLLLYPYPTINSIKSIKVLIMNYDTIK